MSTRKIISDEVDTIFVPSDRKSIKNTLVLTGGGTIQTFFAMGSVGCLIDNGQFEFDLITAISGGTILLTIIDLCHNDTFNYYKEPDWYNRYVRKNMYKLATGNLMAYYIKSGLNLAKLQDYLFSRIPDFNKNINNTNNPKFICEYNFIDGNTHTVSCDHSEIIDLANQVKVDYWYLLRVGRCTLPLTLFNNLPCYDAGQVSNIPVTSLLTRYNPNKIVIVKCASSLIYDTYNDVTFTNMLKSWLLTNVDSASISLNDMIDFAITPNPDNIICSTSNGYNKSQDIYHKDMIFDIIKDFTYIGRMYNGILYTNENAMKISENEGYIQMYHQLKSRNKATVFKIPNPDVYNENTKSIWNDWKNNTNIFLELFKDLIKTKV